MGRKGKRTRLKRLPAPAIWPIHRKEYKWTVKPRPGPHNMRRSLPLLLIVRDMLKLAKTRSEAKFLLKQGRISVDGRIKRSGDYAVGLMDVLEIPMMDEGYRVLPSTTKELVLHPITGGEREYKLCRIAGKSYVKGGHMQLNLEDGRNVLVRIADPRNPVEDAYSTNGTLQISIPEMEVSDYTGLEEGVIALITDGKNTGRWGKVVRLEDREGPYPSTITLEDDRGGQFTTIKAYAFAIGKEEPWITMPGGEGL